MKRLPIESTNNYWNILQGKSVCLLPVCLLMVFFWLSGCSLWDGYLDQNYQTSRAERVCHPYGECSQGVWVSNGRLSQDETLAMTECQKEVDQRDGNGWWADSVTRGLEIGTCMEHKGFTLQQ